MGKSAESTFCSFCFPSSLSHFCPVDKCIVQSVSFNRATVAFCARSSICVMIQKTPGAMSPHENGGDNGQPVRASPRVFFYHWMYTPARRHGQVVAKNRPRNNLKSVLDYHYCVDFICRRLDSPYPSGHPRNLCASATSGCIHLRLR